MAKTPRLDNPTRPERPGAARASETPPTGTMSGPHRQPAPLPHEAKTLTADPLLGLDVGDGYVIGEKIAEGGMGALYVARHRDAPNRRKAIKVLLPDLNDETSPARRDEFRARFDAEAITALKIDHPNVIAVDGYGILPVGSGVPYIKMEFLVGKNLRAWARDVHGGLVAPDLAIQVLAQICGALEQAHKQGVTHRDLKPENVFVPVTDDQSIKIKLLDFGIAKVVGDTPYGVRTQRPKVMGTPGYWAPEQVTSPAAVDFRADLYALAVIAHELVTGERPGPVLNAGTRPPTFPPGWLAVVAAGLAIDPAHRPASVRAFLNGLTEGIEDGPRLAAMACPSLYRTADTYDATIKNPDPLSVPGVRSVPPPPAPTTLGHAAGYRTQPQQVSRARRRGVIAVSGLAAVLATGLVVAAISNGPSASQTSSAPRSVVQERPTAAPPAPAIAVPPAATPTASTEAAAAPAKIDPVADKAAARPVAAPPAPPPQAATAEPAKPAAPTRRTPTRRSSTPKTSRGGMDRIDP